MREHILAFLKKRWPHYAVGIVAIVLSTIMTTSIPKYLGYAIDALQAASPAVAEAVRCAGVMALLAGVGFLVKLLWRTLIIGSGRSVEYYIREQLFLKLQTLPASFYNENKTGDLISRAIVDIQGLRRLFSMAVANMVDIIVSLVISVSFMIESVNLVTTLVVLAPVPIVVLALFYLRRALRRRFTRLQEAIAEISDKVQENTMGIRIVKGFAQEQSECAEFERLSEAKTRAEMRMGRISSLLGPMTNVAFGFSYAIFLVLGARMIAEGSLSVGDYVAVNSYITLIINPVSTLSRIMEIWQSGMASVHRLNHIFYAKNNVDRTADPAITSVEPTVELRHLTFSYAGGLPPALEDVSISLPAGRSLGVMGRTGSGKTTLASVLLKLYPVPDGTVFYGGTDINRIPSAVLRPRIAYVPQDNFLFSDTITHNIAFFDPAITPDRAKQAAEAAVIREEIEQFPDGFDTILGERGVTLSGGQKQRVSIARALVRHAPMVILDDCLSAVDTNTEAAILQKMQSELSGTTSVIISHRASSVEHCDEIVFLENGRILERGTHAELMARGGRYRALYDEQNENRPGTAEQGGEQIG